jgi:hypothetical protein
VLFAMLTNSMRASLTGRAKVRFWPHLLRSK